MKKILPGRKKEETRAPGDGEDRGKGMVGKPGGPIRLGPEPIPQLSLFTRRHRSHSPAAGRRR